MSMRCEEVCEEQKPFIIFPEHFTTSFAEPLEVPEGTQFSDCLICRLDYGYSKYYIDVGNPDIKISTQFTVGRSPSNPSCFIALHIIVSAQFTFLANTRYELIPVSSLAITANFIENIEPINVTSSLVTFPRDKFTRQFNSGLYFINTLDGGTIPLFLIQQGNQVILFFPRGRPRMITRGTVFIPSVIYNFSGRQLPSC